MPKSATPIPARRTSPMRRMSQRRGDAAGDRADPLAVPSTPTKDGERWRASLVTAKISVSENPATSSAVARPIVSSRSTRVRAMCVRPAEISLTKWCSFTARAGSTKRSATSAAAETRNVAASTIATTEPPKAAKIPAPASGATRRSPSRIDWYAPFASASSSSATIAFSIAAARRRAKMSPPRP